MRAKMLLDGSKPKVDPVDLRRVLKEAGFTVGRENADIGVVVGGDGRFGKYGRMEEVPLLFVGVRSKNPAGSRAYLAEAYFDELPRVLRRVISGDYRVEEQRRLEVLKNERPLGEIFTDVYLQRGADSSCIRYSVKTAKGGRGAEDVAVGDGVVICTSAGSTGYYSYPDRVVGDMMDPGAHTIIGRDVVGICHIIPTFTERRGTDVHPLRYTVPWGTEVEISLFRPADARLYGTTEGRGGARVAVGDVITVRPGRSTTKVISVSRRTGSLPRL
ncbi:MAG: NAD(+)/NADH kinase [Nitrososphaerota archaeon]|nr:NAD(+)/NADH kinase [Nitrososphaerota archaeon]